MVWEKSFKKIFSHPRRLFGDSVLTPHYQAVVSAISDEYEFIQARARGGEAVLVQCRHKHLDSERLIKIPEPRYNGSGIGISKKYRLRKIQAEREYEFKPCSYHGLNPNNKRETEDFAEKIKYDVDGNSVFGRIAINDQLSFENLGEIKNIDRARFLRGAKIQAKMALVNFKNGIVPEVLTYSEEPFCYIIMPVVFGISSLDWFKRREYIDKVFMLAKIATFIHEINSRSTIHRDIKPENFLIANDTPVLVDWGLAVNLKAADDAFTNQYKQETGEVFSIGTPKYSHPDLLRDATLCKIRCDAYSFGLSMWSWITESEPSLGLNELEIQNPDLVEQAQKKVFNPEFLPDNEIRGIFNDVIHSFGNLKIAGDIAKSLLEYHQKLSPKKIASKRLAPLHFPTQKKIDIKKELARVAPENREVVGRLLIAMLEAQKYKK